MGSPARPRPASRRRPATILLAGLIGLGMLGGAGGAILGGIGSDGPDGAAGTHLEHRHDPGDRFGPTP
jgi:hypothetical protein